MRIELIYFEGCPHVSRARANVRAALDAAGLDVPLREWNLDDATAPAYVWQHASPTVLVDGRDVTGHVAFADAVSCRAEGAPTVERILGALTSA